MLPVKRAQNEVQKLEGEKKKKNQKENPYYGESENLVTLSPAIM